MAAVCGSDDSEISTALAFGEAEECTQNAKTREDTIVKISDCLSEQMPEIDDWAAYVDLKGWCITAAVMAVSVIVCIFCFVRWERKSSDLSFQFEETTYTYKDEYYDVDKLVYLQMVGSRDKEKERKINQLLEDDRKKVMEMEPPDSYPDDGWEYRFHVGTHRCDVEYADEKFISISYSGWVVRQRKGPYGLPTTMMATTIDCEEMKVLELKDVVSDLNGLCQMLMEDRFKHITAWDGEPDLDFYKVSTTYSREGAERDLLETLNGNDREMWSLIPEW